MSWLPRRTVVVPFDFSEDAAKALATARELIGDPANLHVVHVLPILEAADPGVIWEAIDDESRRQHADAALNDELARLGHGDAGHAVILFGDPGHEVVAYAEEVDAGLIVVASHGKSALRRLLLGSVAERIVRLAHCPVLMLKYATK
ncbi:MAG: universal stress protein [Pirellulales bacterium]|nr:universal stress protein [Pirellulales bacterium]